MTEFKKEKTSPRQTMLVETFSWEWVRTGNKDSTEREEVGKNQPTQGYFFSEEPGDWTPFNLPKRM